MKSLPSSFSVLESLEARLAPAGLVTLNLTASGALTVTGDTLDNDFSITESGDLWTIQALPGSTTEFRLNGGSIASAITFDAPVSMKALLGVGNDEMILSGTLIPGTLTVDAGTGNDVLDLTSTSVGGLVSVKMGTGNDYFTAGGDLFFGKGLTVDLGTGANTFDVNAANLQSKGSISATAAGSVIESQAFILKTGNGLVTGNVNLLTTTGSFTDFEIGDSLDDYLKVTGTMNLQAAAGDDIVILRGDIDTGGLFSMRLGNGANAVISTNLDQLTVRGLTYTGGTGSDNVSLEGSELIVNGTLTFSAGAGTNTLDLNPSEYLGITSALTFTGGTGQDNLIVDGPEVFIGGIVTMNGSSGFNVLGIDATLVTLGGVRFTAGAGGDIVDIGQPDGDSSLVTVRGAVSINTGTGSADVQVRDADIYGNLAITTNAAFGSVDTIQLLDSDFRGTTSISMLGYADSDVVVRDSIFDRNVTVSTGYGDDYVLFDTDTAVSSIYSRFDGYVRIYLGGDNDVFLAGNNPAVATVGNDFNSYIDVDGGSGYDIAYFIDSAAYNNGFNGPLPWTYRVEDVA